MEVPEAMELPAEEGGAAELPGLLTRLLWVFVSPGRLVEGLAAKPIWGAALLVGAVLVAASVALTPFELLMEPSRTAAMERGADIPEMSERAEQITRIFMPLFSVVSVAVMTFLFAGIYNVIFAFVLGDEGSYKQYLAVVSHAWFIPALFALLLVPLKISSGDAQLTLNLGLFMPFMPEGYFQNLFRFIDLTQIWSVLIIAQGAHAIDRRRSFGSATAILLVLLVLMAAVFARFM